MVLWLLGSLGLVAIFFKFFSCFAEELEVDNQIRLELNEAVPLLVVLDASIALVVHLEAHGGDVIVAFLWTIFLASQPAPVEVRHRVKLVNEKFEVGLLGVEAQVT